MNAATILNILGRGMHGHLAPYLTAVANTNYSLVAFVPPINPGLTLNYPNRATSAILATNKLVSMSKRVS